MKENKIEKLILDLSAAWKCSPEEVVDRLNSMNESEINKLINSMTKKFQMGGSLEDRVAFGTTERPRKFNPTEINPISKREAMQKYAGFGYNRGQLRRIYNRAAEHLGKENAAKWMSAAWDQRAPGQAGYLVPAEEQKQGWTKVSAMQGSEMPITNSDPQYFNGPRNFKFKNGGMIDCLRAGGNLTECKKCGGKAPIKAQKGEKMLRTDGVSGYAYRKSDGTLVLTRDGKGPVPLPGSSYQMPGYEPPMSTEMRVETDKGGKPVRYEVDVYEGDESLLPYRTYSSDPSWWQFTRRRLTKEALQRYIDAYKANGLLKKGGKMNCKK